MPGSPENNDNPGNLLSQLEREINQEAADEEDPFALKF
jgi:hypothetical protein